MGAAKTAPIPDGSYYAAFSGVDDADGKEWQGKMLDPGVRWKFAITNGPHKGATAQRITGRGATPDNACGKMLASLFGRMLGEGEDIDAAQFGGRQYLIVVAKGRVETVSQPRCKQHGPGRGSNLCRGQFLHLNQTLSSCMIPFGSVNYLSQHFGYRFAPATGPTWGGDFDRGKQPFVSIHAARADVAQLEAWAARYKDCN